MGHHVERRISLIMTTSESISLGRDQARVVRQERLDRDKGQRDREDGHG